jgi:hypothetical protein
MLILKISCFADFLYVFLEPELSTVFCKIRQSKGTMKSMGAKDFESFVILMSKNSRTRIETFSTKAWASFFKMPLFLLL